MESEVLAVRCRWYSVRRAVLCAALLVCAASFIFSKFVLSPVKISGASMMPNYDDGQRTFINRVAYWVSTPRRGDVVGLHVGSEYLIKRVIGLPGEKIEFDRDIVVVNGQPLAEPYPVRPLLWRLAPVQLGENDYFVMGDNRTCSMLGAVRREDIIGRAVF